MADQQFQLSISTSADLSGITDIQDALEKTQTTTDGITLASGEAAEGLDESVGEKRIALANLVAEAIGKIGEAAGAYSDELGDTDKAQASLWSNIASGASSASAAIKGVAAGLSAKSPLAAGVGGLIGLFKGPLNTAIGDLQSSILGQANAVKFAAEMEGQYQQAVQNRADQAKVAQIDAYSQAQLDTLEAQTREMQKQSLIRSADAAAAQKIHDVSDLQDINAGVPVVQVQATRAVDDTDAEKARINQALSDAEQMLESTKQAVTIAYHHLQDLNQQAGATIQDIDKAKATLATNQQALITARTTAENLYATVPGQYAELDAKLDGSMTNLQTGLISTQDKAYDAAQEKQNQIEQTLTEEARAAISTVIAYYDQNKKKMSKEASDAIEDLVTLANSAFTDPDRAKKIQAAIDALKAVTEGEDQTIADTLASLSAAANEQIQKLQKLATDTQRTLTANAKNTAASQQSLSRNRQLGQAAAQLREMIAAQLL